MSLPRCEITQIPSWFQISVTFGKSEHNSGGKTRMCMGETSQGAFVVLCLSLTVHSSLMVLLGIRNYLFFRIYSGIFFIVATIYKIS